MTNGIIAGRKACMTIKESSEVVGLSYVTYIEREKDPETFKLRELRKLYEAADDYGKMMIKRGINEIVIA